MGLQQQVFFSQLLEPILFKGKQLWISLAAGLWYGTAKICHHPGNPTQNVGEKAVTVGTTVFSQATFNWLIALAKRLMHVKVGVEHYCNRAATFILEFLH